MFDPADTWSSLYEFEKDLAVFFNQKVLEAEIIKSVEGQEGNRILFIRRKDRLDAMATDKKEIIVSSEPKAKGRPISVQTKLKTLAKKIVKAPERDFNKRKLRTRVIDKVK